MPPPQYRFPEAETPVHDCFYCMVELAIMRFFVQHRLFDAIPEEDKGISIPELAQETSIDRNLLERFTNFLVAAGVLVSPAPGQISLNPFSKMFQEPKAKLFYSHIFDTFMGTAVQWPEAREVQSITVWDGAGHPDMSFYQVLETMSERATAFNATMALGLGDMPITGLYDFSWVAEYTNQPGDPDRPLIVDVGGGKGQALKAILAENPKIPAHACVLQDQAEVIQQAIAEDDECLRGAKLIAGSFFDEQTTRGALIYYIRRVLNDWSDEECVLILGQIRSVGAADSRVLVSENLLPDQPSVSLAAADLWMMNFAGKRRNERMFNDIATRAGFKIASIAKDHKSNSAVIEMIPV
ncbi:hypothetical protein ASPSYDRAFT_30881 [Aspergillus sydowii CBS 593.65]|uniref:O-methyltransferase C-terminal domain-containing protein n=1 Tax=Aspergillus sydowii CBS 593.65 TaxID=1036612 RepID=A0A1L9TKV4_9EURO|nr:uncharacterized protein ASPSYDRAFT_30881 [Aspergillus sydowii CBS 593.65]OJJ60066.1 hypothetical protein ASPSYDRAFT_30881 [Aspergillus sydowii CBS 593.65]